MTHAFRVAPTNSLVIEWKADQDGARWCFYMVTDSPNEAKRILALLTEDRQPPLFEMEDLCTNDYRTA